jgi:hypothetical protein
MAASVIKSSPVKLGLEEEHKREVKKMRGSAENENAGCFFQ